MQTILDICKSHGIKISGRGFASCPLHEEKTPSFKVYPTTNSFYCFGCGVGGDLVHLLSLLEGIDNKEAYKKIMSGEAHSTKRQNYKLEMANRFSRYMNIERVRILREYWEAKKLLEVIRDKMPEPIISDDLIPDFFWDIAQDKTDKEILLEISESLNDIDLYKFLRRIKAV
jgi:DNA primase